VLATARRSITLRFAVYCVQIHHGQTSRTLLVNRNACSILICGGFYGEEAVQQLSRNGKMPGVQRHGALRLSRYRSGGQLPRPLQCLPELGRLPSLPWHRTAVEMLTVDRGYQPHGRHACQSIF
jgi:hypothetical protein